MSTNTAGSRILKLYQILHERTDEHHALATPDLVTLLAAEGVESSRKTISADIALLTDMGVDIISVPGRQNRYFVGSRRFELPELRLLIDAVGSSHFITARKSEALIDKLKSLTSVHLADALEQHLFAVERVKPVNESVYYAMDAIASAIYTGKKITFQYMEYTPDKEIVYKHGGKRYAFSPCDMIWSDDRYYAIGYSDSHNAVISFRVDRIKNVEESHEATCPRPADYSVSAYTREIFEMFPGEKAQVALACENGLMKVIIDRFGEDVQTERIDANHFKATVEVSVSPTFFGWLLQFSGRIRIISPQEVKEQMIRICQEAIR